MKSVSLAFLSLILLGSACSPSKSFKGGVAAATVQKNTGDALPQGEGGVIQAEVEAFSKTFKLKTATAPIDMVWVIDNSSSMQEEVGQVRKNFKNFMDSISTKADLQVTLLSGKSGDYGIDLGSMMTDSRHVQVPTVVASNNLLAMLAASICPASAFNGLENNTLKICGQSFSIKGQGFFDKLLGAAYRLAGGVEYYDYPAFGSITNRLREGSKKIFVFVTDDNNLGDINESNFLSLTNSDPKNTHLFAFRGDSSKKGCDVAKKGAAYEALAGQTGGQVFDICESDWSANFAALSKSVVKLATSSFVVEASTNISDVRVTIDGKELEAGAYTVTGGNLVLNDEALAIGGSELRVEYLVHY